MCWAEAPPPALLGAASSRGTMSMRKSNISLLVSADAMSERCSVRRLFSSACIQARIVNSVMKMSHPFANNIGASADIILTSGSAFITFFIRANGS
jgi:hypothetical protein